ncbi:hypothetical protein [Pleionea sp. CnH1-48]|uniref:hypothetical protein n=1 Tax=Pleionea sp. CnH1-48 TaxID=2954494 RepID=UPI002097C8E6|nr:hypothetical protein [Pleionea sp. CnH1-48]MCO7226462.1 hypothetical protein [Pleionea sp. CnH1-48]
MNYKISLLIILCMMLTGANTVNAKELDFTGTWCGQWDATYKVCFDITTNDDGYQSFYRWEEYLKRPMKKKHLKVEQINANTLNMEGKYLIIDLHAPNTAFAFGLFDHQSRVALLKKQSLEHTNQ